jgi:hypothetical protein
MKKKTMFSILVAAVVVLGSASSFAASPGKITICHIPPGNPDNAHEITVSVRALPAHLAHGDNVGECGGGPVGS